MKFIQNDYFKVDFDAQFDGIITDPPYKSFGKQLGGNVY